MHQETKQNFIEKLRLVCGELLNELDNEIKIMLAEHSRDGLLASGATIKKTMNFIAKGNASLYGAVLDYLKNANVAYSPQLESDIQELANTTQKIFKSESLNRLKKSTEIARSAELYERMVTEVEAGMGTDLANFQNLLNSAVLELKLGSHMPPLTKVFWCLEAVLLLVSMFVAGMWYKDPKGNYEPILVGLGLVIPIIAVLIKLNQHKSK